MNSELSARRQSSTTLKLICTGGVATPEESKVARRVTPLYSDSIVAAEVKREEGRNHRRQLTSVRA